MITIGGHIRTKFVVVQFLHWQYRRDPVGALQDEMEIHNLKFVGFRMNFRVYYLFNDG